MQTIIALSGRKQAGKNTLARVVASWYEQQYGVGSVFECSFADNLKDFCIETLGLSWNQCYGTEEEKETPTVYQWENAPKFLRWKFGADPLAKKLVRDGMSPNQLMAVFSYRSVHEEFFMSGPMTARQIMQVLGTDLIRHTFGNVWAAATIRRIKTREKALSIITDNRFPNEVQAVLSETGGHIIRLTRSPLGKTDVHPSESQLDDFDWSVSKCHVLNNALMGLEEQATAIIPIVEAILGEKNVDIRAA